MPIKIGIAMLFFVSQIGGAQADGANSFIGDWRTVRHGAEVRIVDCGDGTPCGFLTSVSADIRDGATHDAQNREPELRGRPLEGLPILWGYRQGQSDWQSGKLYNPETGQTFRSSLAVVSPDRLKVKGCLGPLCREQIWTRIQRQNASIVRRVTNDHS
ncbi:MAG: DUF2147 domain-containing protein [Pseudomonadota bacterium]